MFFLDIDYAKLCGGLYPMIQLVKTVITVVEIGIPIILILLGVFDLGKAVTASKEDEIKAAQKLLIKRVVYAIAIFFVILLVRVVFNVIAANTDDTADAANWVKCWDCKNYNKDSHTCSPA